MCVELAIILLLLNGDRCRCCYFNEQNNTRAR